jgi:hypothetical protein
MARAGRIESAKPRSYPRAAFATDDSVARLRSVVGGLQSNESGLQFPLVHRFPDTDRILAMREDSVFRHAM